MSTSWSEISSKYGVCLEEEEEEEEGHFCVLQFSGAAQRALQQKYTIHFKTMQSTMSASKKDGFIPGHAKHVTEQTIENGKDPTG